MREELLISLNLNSVCSLTRFFPPVDAGGLSMAPFEFDLGSLPTAN